MTSGKGLWITIGVGGVVLAGLVATAGYFLMRNVGQLMKSMPVLTAADFQAGTEATAEEHDALAMACTRRTKQAERCACLADKADDLARFDRLFMTATFELNFPKLAALGAATAAVRKDHNTVIKSAEKHMHETATACGLQM